METTIYCSHRVLASRKQNWSPRVIMEIVVYQMKSRLEQRWGALLPQEGDVAALTRSSLICWENNTPNNKTMDLSPKKNRAAWYQGPMKLEVIKSCGATPSRKRGIYKLFMVLESGRDLRERPVVGYKRPLTIWDFVWGIKYRRFRTGKKTKFQHLFIEMNKTNLPLASLCVFGAYSIVLGFPFVTTVELQVAVNNLRLCMGNKISSISNVK